MEKNIDIHLDIEKHENLMMARIQFSNNSTNEVYLDARTICIGNKISRSVFNITDENNNRVDYIGVLVNREVTPEDFIALRAGEKIETKIVLNEAYEITKNNRYWIQYLVFHPTYMNDAGFTKFESNKVEIVY
jgi:hypothetical protein